MPVRNVHQQVDCAGDPAGRYVLLDETRTLAIDGGNLNALHEALIALSRDYDVEQAKTLVDNWNELLKRPRDVGTYRSLYDESGSLFDEAVKLSGI